MKALVTGANGFTGSYLIKLLLRKGYEVRGIVRNTSNLKLIENLPVELYFADLASHTSFEDAMQDIDVVFHIGAAYRIEGVPQKYYWDVNLEGTRKLLEAAKKKNIKRFVHCSTIGVQGNVKRIPSKEEDPFDAGDYYQKSKLAAEKLALEYSKNGLPLTVIRPTGIYGPGDTRYLKIFKYINSGNFKMIGSGKTYHHLVYVEDLVEGILLAAENEKAVGNIFTIGGNQYLTLNELAEKIAGILNKPLSKIHVPVSIVWLAGLFCEIVCKPFRISPPVYRRRADFFIKNRAFDISKAKRILGYKPRISLDEGLRKTALWYKEQGYL